MKTELPLSIACVKAGKVHAICRSATASEASLLLTSLDQEFIYNKQRNLSLATRFPAIFCPSYAKNIFVCEENGLIVSSLAIKQFEWQDHGQIWQGAMLGSVYTAPSHRGMGRASQLLSWVAEKLKSEGVDFAVLWTAQSAFYAQLGWISAEHGVLGEINGNASGDIVAKFLPNTIAITDADRQKIDRIRGQVLKNMVLRRAEDYAQIPIPAEAIDILWSQGEHPALAYALVGSVGAIAIVYEIVGDTRGFPDLLSRLNARHQRILFNDTKGSESYCWLIQHVNIRWQDKPLSMWLAMSEQLPIEQIKSWYIPYFDRI